MPDAPPTVDRFRQEFPEFAAEEHADAVVQRALNNAFEMHSLKALATLYLAAHLVAIGEEHTGQPDGGSGEIIEERTGPFTQKFTPQGGKDGKGAFYARTSYGRMFLELERRTPAKRFPRVFG